MDNLRTYFYKISKTETYHVMGNANNWWNPEIKLTEKCGPSLQSKFGKFKHSESFIKSAEV